MDSKALQARIKAKDDALDEAYVHLTNLWLKIEALQADNARLRDALIKIDTLDGIGGPDGEVQCANIARTALQETSDGH